MISFGINDHGGQRHQSYACPMESWFPLI